MKKPQCQSFCGKYYGWISFSSNLFNAAFKIGVGLLTASQALIADGLHSLSDALTAIVTIATLIVSRRPGDKSHPYGHGKIEFIASAFFGMMLLALSLAIMVRSIRSMTDDALAPPNFLAIGPAVVSILVNIALSNYGLCVGRNINSPVIIANAKENRADAFSSVASLVGIVGALMGYPFFDPLAAVVVSLLIGRMGIEILVEASAGLMDSSVEKNTRKEMRGIARDVEGVQKVAFLKTRRIGQKIWADLGIDVRPSIALNKGDRIAREVRNALMRHYPNLQDAVVYLDTGPRTPGRRTFLQRVVPLFRR